MQINDKGIYILLLCLALIGLVLISFDYKPINMFGDAYVNSTYKNCKNISECEEWKDFKNDLYIQCHSGEGVNVCYNICMASVNNYNKKIDCPQFTY